MPKKSTFIIPSSVALAILVPEMASFIPKKVKLRVLPIFDNLDNELTILNALA
ncbi:MAG: hypothetical protein WC462_02005 [archaeon]